MFFVQKTEEGRKSKKIKAKFAKKIISSPFLTPKTASPPITHVTGGLVQSILTWFPLD